MISVCLFGPKESVAEAAALLANLPSDQPRSCPFGYPEDQTRYLDSVDAEVRWRHLLQDSFHPVKNALLGGLFAFRRAGVLSHSD